MSETKNDPGAFEAKPFTFAHLTDLHLPTHGRFAPGELLGKRMFSALSWARGRRRRHRRHVAEALREDVLRFVPGHVAVTGDIVNFGLERECRECAQWLREFGAPGCISFVPGNHESLHADSVRRWRAAFAPFTTTGDWPFALRKGDVAFIGVSTSIPTPVGSAQGEVGVEQRAKVGSLLAEHRDVFRIVLMHHPPTDITHPRKALRDRRQVVATLVEGGADIVLHGHDHRSEVSWIFCEDGRRIPVIGAPSASTPHHYTESAEWRLFSVVRSPKGWLVSICRRCLLPDGSFGDYEPYELEIPFSDRGKSE